MRRAITLGVMLALAGPALADEETRERLADRVRITVAQAERAALKAQTGRVREIELRVRAGKPVYRIKFTDGRKVWVDAVTGAVVRCDRAPRRDDD